MAKLQKASSRNRGSAWQRIWDSLTGNPGRLSAGRKPRRLMVDQLEERQLLSVSPASLDDVLINQLTTYSQSVVAGKSVAGDNTGDFVVTWTRNDYTGGTSDSNIYARYYTDAVQRIELPTGSTSFKLQYNGNAIDTLSISAGKAPFLYSQNPIVVTIDLSYNGAAIPTIDYDENNSLEQNALAIQTALRDSPIAELDDVTVQATDAYNFIINYGPKSEGQVSSLTVENVDYDPLVAVADRCFLPAAEITNTRIPGTTIAIPISSTNAAITAANIEYALEYGTTQYVYTAPIVFPDPARISATESPAGPYNYPTSRSTPSPNVKVTALSATDFEITFIGDSGKLQQPLMTVLNSASTVGNPILLVGASSTIIKQTSDEFRVNDTEADDPSTLAVDVFDQTNAHVAMDADGDFVITWQSGVSDFQDYGSVTDIYARLFTPSGYNTHIQDIQVSVALGQTFTGTLGTDKGDGSLIINFDGTNDLTLAAAAASVQQSLHSLGYDPDSTRVTVERINATDYVLHIQLGGKDVSEINTLVEIENIVVSNPGLPDPTIDLFGSIPDPTSFFIADMDHDGVAETGIQSVMAVNDQFLVNTITTNPQARPSVGMDAKGNFTIAWQSQGQNLSFFNQIKAQRYDYNGNPLGLEFDVSNEDTSVNWEPYVAVSDAGDIIIGWSNSNDPNQYLNGVTGVGTRAKVFSAEGNVLIDQFAGPGAGIDGIAVDRNGNFVITGSSLNANDDMDVYAQEWQLYDADGNVSGAVLRDTFRVNSASFDTGAANFWPNGQFRSQPAMDADGDLVIVYEGFGPDVSETDIDQYIARQLVDYMAANPGISDYELGLERLRLEKIYGLLRGEAFAAMFSQFDADPNAGQAPSTILTSDSIANNLRDGSNTTYLLSLDPNAISGTFTLRLYVGGTDAGYVDIAITPVFLDDDAGINATETIKVIHDAISGVAALGINWPQAADGSGFEGPVDVRQLSPAELTRRSGTPWDPSQLPYDMNTSQYIYEITFMGEVHDSRISLSLYESDLQLTADATAEVQRIIFSQTGAVTPTGSFTFTIGGFTSGTIGFNTANMNAVAGNIEAELQTVYPGATVNYVPGGPPWVFNVVFGGVDAGIDQPRIRINMDATLAINASATVVEVVKGHSEAVDADTPDVVLETYYDMGTFQTSTSIAMSSDGDYVIVWQQYDSGSDNFYYRTFQESTDTAGPTVANALSAMGDVLDQNVQVTVADGLQHIVLSFDEEMQNTAEIQTLTFTASSAGWYSLKMGDLTSAPLWFNPANPSSMAASLQTAIETLAGGLGGVKVAYKGSLKFQVTFDGNYRGLYRPLLQMVMGDPALTYKGTITAAMQYDSVTNPMNYRLLLGGTELAGSIIKVEYGLNKASELAVENSSEYGDLDIKATNKWEVVITIDGNGSLPGTPLLASGTYTIEAITPVAVSAANPTGTSGLRDLAGNPLGYTGFEPLGVNYSQQFTLVVSTQEDTPTDPSVGGIGANGYTSPESPGAVAVDADGDHIVTWTAYDSILQRDRVYFQVYDANGAAISQIMAITPKTTDPGYVASDAAFLDDDQGYATVACDADGDFIVTWTNYRDENGDAALDLNGDGYVDGQPGVAVREQIDVYARRFSMVNGSITPMGDAFRVNSYTVNDQLWSNVAMNATGEFVITWSSMGQEDNNQLGSGYGIYARRYDSFGQPIGLEFQVNITTAGSQQNSSVAMAADGGFVVAWQSEQNGVQSDIIARSFNPDGSPQEGPLFGEVVINSTTAGNQRYPDISMNLEGTKFVVTWQSSSQDGSGWGVYSRQFNRVARSAEPQTYTFTEDPVPDLQIPDGANDFQSTINVTSASGFLLIRDLRVHLDITDPTPRDLTVWLTSPNGTKVQLFARVPRALKNGTVPNGADFNGTIFDDAALVKITDSDAGAVPPFSNTYIPQEALSVFDGENAVGTWTLHINDYQVNDPVEAQFLNDWALEVVEEPAGGPETLINATTAGNQLYPSVAMAYDGSYVVTWSGNGAQTNQVDSSGVFFQRFDLNGIAVGTETRANITTTGTQWISSIGSDAVGNFVIAWTGAGSTAGTSDVYRYISANSLPSVDDGGPIVTDVLLADRTRIQEGDTVQPAAPGITQLIVVFSENLYTGKNADGTPGLHSALNPQNWTIYRNGSDVTGAITNITFGLNPLSRKYEAVLTFNALAVGNYTLVASDQIWDAAMNYNSIDGTYVGNMLDGDYDGTPGTNPSSSDQPGFSIQFTATTTPQVGAEYRVNGVDAGGNDTRVYNQVTSQVIGTGVGQEETTRALAMDHSGNFAVVWTSYGQDDPNDSQGAGVYMRMFDRDNNPLTAEFLVNTFTAGEQRNGAIAMDADGDFVVVWESQNQDPDGSWGVYGQRFNSMGQKIGGEFRINTNYTNNQMNPAVAMDNDGNFVVVWVASGQSFSYFNDIRGQIYDRQGNRVGNEFRVNSADIPGTGVPGGSEVNPSVAMGDVGTIVVAWDQNVVQVNGVVTDSNIMARMFDNLGTPIDIDGSNLEFQVNVGDDGFISDPPHNPKEPASTNSGTVTRKTARNSQISMDNQGNFIVVWESFHDNDLDDSAGPESYGIYFRRFNADGTLAMATEHQANLTITDNRDQEARDASTPVQNAPYDNFAGSQVNPTIAMDADGDYVIAWEGNGATPHPLDMANGTLQSDMDDQGIWIRSFHAQGAQDTNEAVSVQTRVNITAGGDQKFPSLAMTSDGDVVVVWSGNGVGDRNGVFFRRYNESTDTVGPMLTDFLLPDGTPINSNQQVQQSLAAIVVTFDENMLDNAGHTGNAVTNPNNYRLLKDGIEVVGGISQVFFGLNMANTLSGQYGISSAKTNKYEAVLVVDANGASSGVLPLGEGHYEIVAKNSLRDKAGNPLGSTGVNPNGSPMSQTFDIVVPSGQEIVVAGNTIGGKQTTSQSIGGDADGDHVVVWTNTNAGQQGVYFKLYNVTWTNNAAPTGRTATYTEGLEIRITSDATAREASVARDADGDFVVTWTAQNGANGFDVFAQRFNATGTATTGIFRVNTHTEGAQSDPAVAMDTEGNFVITWQSLDQDESGYGIYAQRFSRDGQRLGGASEMQSINFIDQWTGNFSLLWDHDNDPSTADRVTTTINYAGNMAATAEVMKTALKNIGADVEILTTGSRATIIFKDASGAVDQSLLRVNPANLVKTGGSTSARIEITTFQDGDSGEFRVNDTTISDQTDPSIAMDADGNFVISWTSSVQGDDGSWNTDIYAKRFATSGAYWNTNNIQVSSSATGNANLPSGADFLPFMTTVDNPGNHQVAAGTGYDGVVQVDLYVPGLLSGYGSGVLLAGTNVILTAAHVATVDGTNIPWPTQYMSVTFDTVTGPVTIGVSQIYSHPDWNWNLADGNDIALLVLDSVPPEGVQGYEIYRATDEIGKIGDIYGYGAIGTGATGSENEFGLNNASNNLKYSGKNRIDATSDIFGFADTFLVSDFDSGSPTNDALGIFYNLHDLGLGAEEANTTPGDSGGPMFIDGKIAGISSWGMSYPGSQDPIPGVNSSYGEFFGETRVSTYASWIDSIVAYGGSEFLVNADDVLTDQAGLVLSTVDNTAGDQKWSSVGMDNDGDFVVSWTSAGQDGVGSGYGAGAEGENGVFARRYNARATQATDGSVSYTGSNVFQVNDTAGGDQQRSVVAMDANGDFAIAWESAQSGDLDIYAKRYARTSLVQYALDAAGALVGNNPLYGANGEIGSEFIVNSTKSGDQSTPSIAMNEAGDFAVVWNGAGPVADPQGVYLQRFNRPKDDAGPLVADVLAMQGSTLSSVADDSTLANVTSKFVLAFGEDVSIAGGVGGANSILNPNNWILLRDGEVVPGAVSTVEYGKSQAFASGLMAAADGKYEAVVTFKEALGPGSYVLTLKESVKDLFGNNLDGNFDGTAGGNFVRTFTVISGDEGTSYVTAPGAPDADATDTLVNAIEDFTQGTPAVAADAQGNYVVIWATNQSDDGDIMGQRYDRFGRTVGRPFLVSSYLAIRDFFLQSSTSPGLQIEPDVAMDNFGNFVVTWAGTGADDEYGIYARVFDANGAALGDEFRVNVYDMDVQNEPSVAMDADGDFVITWTSFGQDGDLDGIYARRYNILGQPVTGEIRVNSATANRQQNSDVAMDADGDFVVTWESYAQDGSAWGIYGQRFNAAGAKLGGEFRVNQFTNDNQDNAKAAMDAAGDFVVTWSSFGQDGSGYGIYARRYNAAGTALSNEFLVNQTTLNWQVTPDVGMDAAGNFNITWSSQSSTNSYIPFTSYSIFARMYNADGSDSISPSSGQALREFRVNADAFLNQMTPAIGVADNGQYVVVWSGPDSDDMGIYSRVINPSSISTLITQIPPTSTIGLASPTSSTFYLKNSNTAGIANSTFVYGPAGSGWIALSGDWDGDGLNTIGLYSPTTSTFYLKNSNSAGNADLAFVFGPAGAGWTPIVGDWDGDGIETIGLYNPASATFYLRNTNDAGFANITALYGPAGAGWTPIAGDWDGDGIETIGLYSSGSSTFFLRNTNNTGIADTAFSYGPGGAGWTPIAGDWNADGQDTIGLYSPGSSTFYLRNANAAGFADMTFVYGPAGAGWTPITGAWTTAQPLMAAAGTTTADADATALTQADLQPIVTEAITRWKAAGLDSAALEKLQQVQFVIGDLSGAYLGKAQADRIYLDSDAAGHGWFVDSTPAQDEEYSLSASGDLQAIDSRAVDRIDLLSVVEHELGHIAGLDDLDALADSLMSESFEAGVRRNPSAV